MFSSSKSDSYSSTAASGASTVIARGVKVEGDFSSEGDVVIEGQVNGNLSTSAILTVGPEAVIKADVKAREATVSGTVEGNMVVTARLHLLDTAKIIGDITAENIEIESGAQIHGKIAIGQKPVPNRASEVPVSTRALKASSRDREDSIKIPKFAE